MRGGQTDNPNATSAERAAQTAFASQRSGGFQLAIKSQTINAAIGDVVVIENTSSSSPDRPIVILPALNAGMTGKSVIVTFAKNSTTAHYMVSAADGINVAPVSPTSKANRTISSPTVGYVYTAVGPGYGWREYALES